MIIIDKKDTDSVPKIMSTLCCSTTRNVWDKYANGLIPGSLKCAKSMVNFKFSQWTEKSTILRGI